MADDVKVKFGGDFSDIPKGAAAAAEKAGSAMKSWAGDFGKSLAGSFVGIFAAESVIGSIKDFASGVREQLTYFKELSHVIEKTNVDAKEFQQLASYARENGVAMETLGRGMAFANVYLGKVKEGTKAAREELKALKFTEEEINSGRIKSINILMRLADAYQVEGQEERVAKHLKDIFGKTGIELLPMMKGGSSEMKERMDEAKTYSEYQIKAAAELAKVLDKLERKKKELEKKAAITSGVIYNETEMGTAYSQTIREFRAKNKGEKSLRDTLESQLGTEAGAKSFAEVYLKNLKDQGVKPEMAILRQAKLVNALEAREATGENVGAQLERARNFLNALVTLGEKKTKGVELGKGVEEAGSPALAVSSLQAIGGGDISSIFSGSYQDTMLAQTTRIADATVKTAENTQPQVVTGRPVIPATK